MARLRTALSIPCISLVLIALTVGHAAAQQADPLPSWNDGPVKTALMEFVATVTEVGGAGFVPPEERIATFDNDGTLWVEQPIYTQVVFMIEEAKRLSAQHPEWQDNPKLAPLLNDSHENLLKITEEGFAELLAVTHSGITGEAFDEQVSKWIDTAVHPRFDQLYLDLTYLPQVELMTYLRQNDFKVFIVSGGGIAFIRAWADGAYGIAPPDVVGSNLDTTFSYEDGKGTIVRDSKVDFVTDGPGKAEGIYLHIGQRPILAFGNSGGDKEMLEYTKSGDGERMALIVYHDDAEREYAYGPAGGLPDTGVGVFDQALMDQAESRGWHVVSMKDDWKQIFAFEETPAMEGSDDQ